MLVTNNKEYYEKAKLLRSHGMTSLSYERARGHSTEYDVVSLGYNYRIDDIRSSIGIVQLDKLEGDLKRRNEIRRFYEDHLLGLKGLIIPFTDYQHFSTHYVFPVILADSTRKKRDETRASLAEKGIQTSVHYPAVHQFSIYKRYSFRLPKTEYVADNLISLPMYSNLSDDKVEYTCSMLRHIIAG